MRLKFAVLVLGIFVLFTSMIAGISAVCTGGNSQIIMKLYQNNNSHGALWNDALYTYDICYDSIFGVLGSGIHTCSGTNTILWLYQNNNSHASNPQAAGYNTPVCYGDLVCKADTSAGSTCADTDKKVVVRLYQSNNSHISNAGFTSYPIKICCNRTGGAPPTVPNAYWANTAGTQITTAQEGDTVLMIFENSNLPSGTVVTFEIYENDTTTEDSIRTVALGNAITGTVDGAGKATGSWLITSTDLGKTLDFDKFVFKVTGNRSNFLTVNPAGGPPPLPFNVCEFTETQSWWWFGGDKADSTNDCYKADGFPETECCPENAYCKLIGSVYTCSPVSSCKNLTTQAECDGNTGLAAGDLEGVIDGTCGIDGAYDSSPNCKKYLDCECKWNGTACLASYEKLVWNGSRLFTESQLNGKEIAICGGIEDIPFGECIYDISIIDNCEEPGGKILRSWTAIWTGAPADKPAYCEPGNDEPECSSIVRLSFFTWINTIAVIVILFVVYGLYAISNKKRKNNR